MHAHNMFSKYSKPPAIYIFYFMYFYQTSWFWTWILVKCNNSLLLWLKNSRFIMKFKLLKLNQQFYNSYSLLEKGWTEWNMEILGMSLLKFNWQWFLGPTLSFPLSFIPSISFSPSFITLIFLSHLFYICLLGSPYSSLLPYPSF